MEVELLLQCDFNTIEFITIATTGNAQDFGDLTWTSLIMLKVMLETASSPTRCVILLVVTVVLQDGNIIDFVEILQQQEMQQILVI